jgi:hypothetical protein
MRDWTFERGGVKMTEDDVLDKLKDILQDSGYAFRLFKATKELYWEDPEPERQYRADSKVVVRIADGTVECYGFDNDQFGGTRTENGIGVPLADPECFTKIIEHVKGWITWVEDYGMLPIG